MDDLNIDDFGQTLSNANASTLVNNGIVFDPRRDLPPAYVGIPDIWASSLETLAPNITGMIADQSTLGETWIDTLQKMLPILAATAQQREILKIQLERARQGLPPLPNSDFGAQVSIGLDPTTRNVLIFSGLAIVAFVAWKSFRKG